MAAQALATFVMSSLPSNSAQAATPQEPLQRPSGRPGSSRASRHARRALPATRPAQTDASEVAAVLHGIVAGVLGSTVAANQPLMEVLSLRSSPSCPRDAKALLPVAQPENTRRIMLPGSDAANASSSSTTCGNSGLVIISAAAAVLHRLAWTRWEPSSCRTPCRGPSAWRCRPRSPSTTPPSPPLQRTSLHSGNRIHKAIRELNRQACASILISLKCDVHRPSVVRKGCAQHV